MYTLLNRIYCTDAVRKEKYSEAAPWLSTTKERAYVPPVLEVRNNAGVVTTQAVEAQFSPELIKVLESVTFDSRANSTPALFRGGVDGLFPLSTQSNSLR